MRGRFIVLEGLDGSGKSTQLEKLTQAFTNAGHQTCFIHFPRTNESSPFFGDLIARFLRGEFGNADEVDPYIVALLFAGDRFNDAKFIKEKIDSGITVLADRYVLSNIAFQCAKLSQKEDQMKLMQWIVELEYEYFNIPKPDASMFLHVPFEFVEANLQNNRKGNDRDYLQGYEDIHEADLSFQQKVFNMYMLMATQPQLDLTIIDCHTELKEMTSPDQTSTRIVDFLITKNLI